MGEVKEGSQSFTDAVDSVYSSINQVLLACPVQASNLHKLNVDDHIFGGEAIQPLAPQLQFELTDDCHEFETKFGRLHTRPKAQVLKHFMQNMEDNMLAPTMLDDLFEFDLEQLQK